MQRSRCFIDSAACRARYEQALTLAMSGHHAGARNLFKKLLGEADDAPSRALLSNDLAAVSAVSGRTEAARAGFEAALKLDSECDCAQLNRNRLSMPTIAHTSRSSAPRVESARRKRIAILSLLFNWPSTGGGTIHTYEAAKFLQAAGYEVRHIYARQDDWGLGKVSELLAVDSDELQFSLREWNPERIRSRFRAAIDAFSPDFVLITDSWNTKPLLAEAAHGYRYFLRIAALESLCPLNNVRLLVDRQGHATQCHRNQLDDPYTCRGCVADRQGTTGTLHRAERELAAFYEPDYPDRLHRAMAGAEAVLVVNPFIAELVRPHARRVCVIPSGFDPDRFERLPRSPESMTDDRLRIFFAGLVEEYMKGFPLLHAAAERLWQERRDFELIVTAGPPGKINDFTRFIGWQSQQELPKAIAACDILAFPTLAQEALGRSAVEAMGCGRPVVASRLGGLSWVVDDEITGLLFEPGNVDDLTSKLRRLLDDADLRQRMGAAGREKFLREFTWKVILDRSYAPLLGECVTAD